MNKYFGEVKHEIVTILKQDYNSMIEREENLKQQLAQAKMNESFEKEKKENAFKFIEELKQQLAEKEKGIEEWRSLYSALMKDCQMQIEEYNRIKNQLSDRESRWAKYSKKLCIEQLEKVSQDFSMRVGITDSNMDLLNEIIDNQIAELKKGSEQNDK